MVRRDEVQSATLKALADESRLRLARLLAREELSVQELCEVLALPQPKVSRHLAVMRAADLVRDRREGSRVYYRLAELGGELQGVADYLRRLAEQEHPDGERLAACLRKRTRLSRDFAQQRADEWDELGMQLHSSTAALLALARLAPPGLVVADIGTGTGLLLPVLASFASTVYAVDHSDEMLGRARRRCEEHGLKNVRFLCCDAGEVPAQLPQPCDAMLLHFVLHQISQPAAVVRSVSQGLKTGGRLVVVDRTAHEDEEARAKFGSLWLGFAEETVARWLGAAGLQQLSWQVLRPQPGAPGAFPLFIASGTRGG